MPQDMPANFIGPYPELHQLRLHLLHHSLLLLKLHLLRLGPPLHRLAAGADVIG